MPDSEFDLVNWILGGVVAFTNTLFGFFLYALAGIKKRQDELELRVQTLENTKITREEIDKMLDNKLNPLIKSQDEIKTNIKEMNKGMQNAILSIVKLEEHSKD